MAKEKTSKTAAAKQENLGGGMTKQKLENFANRYKKLKAEADEIRGDMGPLLKDFEEQGGHKLALKTALKLQAMETSKAQDFYRSFENYCEALGIYDQHDLFDPVGPMATKPDTSGLGSFDEGAIAH